MNNLNNLEARGVEPLFPACMSSNVHGWFTRAILEASTFSMHKRGRTRMLLVLLLGGKRLETPGIAVMDRLFP